MARLKGIEKLTLRDMIIDLDEYIGITDGLIQLPYPVDLKIGRKRFPVPQTMDEFTKAICYGQRLFLPRKEDNDIGLITRMIDGYYYPIVTVNKWDEEKALLFGNKVLTCKVKELYPIAMHFVELIGQMTDREKKLLHREPTKVEQAAGIERLDLFSELNALDFLRDAMKCTVPEVLLTSYNECLVRFMNAKELSDYQERYFQLLKEQNESTQKFAK